MYGVCSDKSEVSGSLSEACRHSYVIADTFDVSAMYINPPIDEIIDPLTFRSFRSRVEELTRTCRLTKCHPVDGWSVRRLVANAILC